MIHLDNSALLSLMYKGGLVVLQALYMYSCRGLLWNSKLYSIYYLVRDLRHSYMLDNLAANSTHIPMSSSVFPFSCKIMSWFVWTLYFNIIRSVLKWMIFSWKSSPGDLSTLLNVYVHFCTICTTIIASTCAFDKISGNGSSCTPCMSFSPSWSCSTCWFTIAGSSLKSSWPPSVKTILCSSSLVVKCRCCIGQGLLYLDTHFTYTSSFFLFLSPK